MEWLKEHEKVLLEYKEAKLSYVDIAKLLVQQYKLPFTEHSVKHKYNRIMERQQKQEEPNYKTTTEICADGSHKSDKLLKMSENQSKDINYLLEAHGYDMNAWELVNARSNIWNTNDKKQGVQTLYSSKITVKPQVREVNNTDLINAIKNIKPVKLHNRSAPLAEVEYLKIALFDMHFGNATLKDYEESQVKISGLLDDQYKKVLFIIGQDLLHNNDFRGNTAKGTPIDKVDMEKAAEDALNFYSPLIKKALEITKNVHIIYSKGNHDESSAWWLVQVLKARHPEVTCDDKFTERKAYMLGSNFIGTCHGEKQSEKDLVENFATEFPMMFARATNREVDIGHRHSEMVIDKGGILIRRMPTRNPDDDYHKDNGYTKAHKRFQIMGYSETDTERIYYV